MALFGDKKGKNSNSPKAGQVSFDEFDDQAEPVSEPSVSDAEVTAAAETDNSTAFESAASGDDALDAGSDATGFDDDVIAPDANANVVPDLEPLEAMSGKSGKFRRGERIAKPKAERKAKAPKAPKEPKVKKVRAKKVKAVESAEDLPMPVLVAYDFYQGMTKEREAEQIARAFIESNFDAPNASYIYMQRWHNGIAVEMQEGGGRAYLPEALAMLDENPEAVVAVPMSNRFAQIRIDKETGQLETLLLAANETPQENSFIPLPTTKMTPFDRRGSRVFVAGIATLMASVIALMFAMGSFFLDTDSWSLPYLAQTQVQNLPSSQIEKVNSAMAQGDCVLKMEFVSGNWNIQTGYDNNGICGPVRQEIIEVQPSPDGLLPEDLPETIETSAGTLRPVQ